MLAPALVFSDGACEGDGRIQDIGFVVMIPRSHARPLVQGEVPSLDRLARDYDIRHGAAALPLDLRGAFVARKTQIGQVEIIGAIAAYLTLIVSVRSGALGALAGRHAGALAGRHAGRPGKPARGARRHAKSRTHNCSHITNSQSCQTDTGGGGESPEKKWKNETPEGGGGSPRGKDALG